MYIRIISIVVFLLSTVSGFAQTAGKKEFLSIQDAMSIVSCLRTNPMINDDEFDGYVKQIIGKYNYVKADFLEGIGTCGFWQYINHGHTVYTDPLDDDFFVPDNKELASAVAVMNCTGVECVENNETAIEVEYRVYTEQKRNELLKEMQNIGFTYMKTEYKIKEYVWNTYTISFFEGMSRGHKYWSFRFGLNARVYGSTKTYEYADSSETHNLKIRVDYPIIGNPKFLRKVRTFMMEVMEYDILYGEPMTGRYNGDASNGQAVINFYGMKGSSALKAKHGPYVRAFEEETIIKKVAENDYFVSYEVSRLGWYGGVTNLLNYGASFRKSDGKRLHVIANPEDPQFKHFLNSRAFSEKKNDIVDRYKNNLPMPVFEPYLVQDAVRFVYQKYEIAPGFVGHIEEYVSFSEIRKFLSDEVKDVLR